MGLLRCFKVRLRRRNPLRTAALSSPREPTSTSSIQVTQEDNSIHTRLNYDETESIEPAPSTPLGHTSASPQLSASLPPSTPFPSSSPSARCLQEVHLFQVHPASQNAETEPETDIDIIAIHGLDTRSPDTWTWKNPENLKDRSQWVNWLKDLLPREESRKINTARIFTCDWPADLFERSDFKQKTIKEIARRLLDGIKERPSPKRRILFIASCLGGIILMQALVLAIKSGDHNGTSDLGYRYIGENTRAIIFLATPFRGTSFKQVARWAELLLNFKAGVQRQRVTDLLSNVKEDDMSLRELVWEFTSLCLNPVYCYHVFNFYELGHTNLLQKVTGGVSEKFLWQSDRGGKPEIINENARQLVDGTSGTLDIVPNPAGLERTHLLMNKFRGGQNDGDYQSVVAKIGEFLQLIRDEDPYAWIRKHHYNEEKLRIQRLSHNSHLPMEDCYINLSIVEHQSCKDSESLNGGVTTHGSSLSFKARLKIDTSEDRLIPLPELFNPRPDSATRPTRILIRGRAGVGKTTLCKKIVHDFHSMDPWTNMFKRVLWVPLRKLKMLTYSDCNLENLFSHLFFETHPETAPRRRLAKDLSITVTAEERRRTLFIFDGLDEVSELLDPYHAASNFLTELLNSPNVIITTRPHGVGLADLKQADLELETLGFLPDQVGDYVRSVFRESPSSIDQVLSFLDKYPLVGNLVRIPVQLDALCSTWDEGNIVTQKMETMTDLYQAIELKLWKKDTRLLNARTRSVIEHARSEMTLIELMAFAGLSNEVIDFDSTQRDRIYDIHLKHLPEWSKSKQDYEGNLARISFLRTSDSSLDNRNTSYHFLHLTYQEYFAAHYFVRRWRDGTNLDRLDKDFKHCESVTPSAFLRQHKLDPRYNILWRFVAGLLEDEGHPFVETFFNKIIQEREETVPQRERLQAGFPMNQRQWNHIHRHQQLFMYCLSEVSENMPQRRKLEDELLEWVWLDTEASQWEDWGGRTLNLSAMVSEVEFPEYGVCKVLQGDNSHLKMTVLEFGDEPRMKSRQGISSQMTEAVVEALKDPDPTVRPTALRLLARQPNKSVETWTAMTKILSDENIGVRRLASCCYIPSERCASVHESFWMAWRELLRDEEDLEVASNALVNLTMFNPTDSTWGAISKFLCGENEAKVRRVTQIATRGRRLSGDIWARWHDILENKKQSQTRIAVLNSWKPTWSAKDGDQGHWKFLERLLAHKDGKTREIAIRKVSNQMVMPEEIWEAVMVLQKDEDELVRAAAEKFIARVQDFHQRQLRKARGRGGGSSVGVSY